MDELQTLKFNFDRRFGVEVELNAFDRRDFKAQPLRPGEMPEGTAYIASLLMENLKAQVKVHGWKPTHNNFEEWIIKPDSSCGLEVCSPAEKAWTNLRNTVKAIDALSADPRVSSDDRCSLHVHVNVLDCIAKTMKTVGMSQPAVYDWSKSYDLISVLAWWIKCEPVFLEMVPDYRKVSRYCMSIGMTDEFDAYELVDSSVVQRLGEQKYYTCNCYHLWGMKRPTVEFRIVGNEGCLNSNFAKNWIVLVMHFVEMAKYWGPPEDYRWLDPSEVFTFLGFGGAFELAEPLKETRNWFLSRMLARMEESNLTGIWSPHGRNFARQQAREIAKRFQQEEKLA